MKTDPFIIERTFNASIDKVWKALTDKNEMKQWYFDLPAFEPRVGFEFQFEAGEEGNIFLHLCRVTEVIPNRKIAYTWRYDGYAGNSSVTFELFKEGAGKTRLKLSHAGLDTFPDQPAFAKEKFAQGWTSIVGTSLKEFLEK
jgi:uncharacterized protein YndB with AHSA1/START domain